MPAKTADFSLVRDVALEFPDVKEASSTRGIAFTVAGRLLACQAIHPSAEPNSLMVRVSHDERARLLARDPETYYVTEHYRKHPAVLVRLAKLRRKALRNLLATAWLFVSEKAATAKSGTAGRELRASPSKPRHKRRARS
jgi:hypothetical protein